MKHNDEAQWREWVDLDLDGAQDLDSTLGPAERAELKRLEKSGELTAERRSLRRLHEILKQDQIAVRPGFQQQVMAGLPAAAWEPRNHAQRVPAWAFPLVLVLAFGAAAAALLGSSLAHNQSFGLVATLFDFLMTTTLAGAGLLFATWRGLGFGLSELFAGSEVTLAVFGAAVLGLNLLIVSYLRKRRPVPVWVERSED